MKRATKAAAVSIIPVFEEVLSKSRSRSLPVIQWSDEVENRRERSRRAIEERDLAAAFKVACEHIRILEAHLFALAKIAQANMR